MDAVSGALTAGTKAAAGQERGQLEGSQLLRTIALANANQAHLAAETEQARARAAYYQGRTPQPGSSDALRTALINAGNDPDDVDAAIAASERGDHSGLRALFAQPKTPPAPRVLRTPGGYMALPPGAGSTATPILGPDRKPVMPVMPRGGAGRVTTAETPEHRNARQGMSAVNEQLQDTRAQIAAMDRARPPLVQYPGVVTGSSADSAAARAFTTKHDRLEQRADSLRGVASDLAGSLSRAAGVGSPRPASRSGVQPSASTTARVATADDYAREAEMYKAAVAKIRQAYSGAELADLLNRASDRYNQRVQALASGRQP